MAFSRSGNNELEMKNKFAQRLKELRAEKNMTRYQLTLALNLGTVTVKRWEEGGNIPNAEYIVLLCEFFGCSADFLLGLKDE